MKVDVSRNVNGSVILIGDRRMTRPAQPSIRRLLAFAAGVLLLCAGAAPPDDPVLVDNPGAFGAAAGTVGGCAGGPWHLFGVLLAGEAPEVNFWSIELPMASEKRRKLFGASTLFLDGFGPRRLDTALTTLATVRAGEQLQCWAPVDSEKVYPIPRDLLGRVLDHKPIPSAASGDPELDAYHEFVRRASQTSDAAFLKAAEELDRGKAREAPQRCRGNVYTLEGRLVRLRDLGPDTALRQAGVRGLYEGWIDQRIDGKSVFGAHPVCVLFTELPSGLKPAEKLDVSVRFAGYYYKLYRYEAADPNKPFQETPLLIGHTIALQGNPAAEAEPGLDWFRDLVPGFIVLLCVVFGAILGITLWYRYADEKVRRRITKARHQDFVPPSPEEAPTRPSEPEASAREDHLSR
jgi:hypothetical protein